MKNIFVSSTFRDMQAERDMIQKEVLPQLRNKARAYGENINMIDLRWGVDTSELESEEGSMKVMSVCLDEVERSRPYMLIFLGERYGSIIDPAITEKVIARKNSDFSLEDYAISITAMEIEFGALSEQFDSLENCVVCMRNFSPDRITDEAERAVYSAEDEERAKKQQELKEKITQKVQGRVIEYSCDWDAEKKQLVHFRTAEGETLSDKLISTYEAMFRKEWNEYSRLSWEEKEQLAVNALMESKLRSFSGREQLIDNYYNKIINESGVLILQGEVGSGKTSIVCKLIERLEERGKKVFRFVANHSAMSETAMQLVQQMVYYLENVLGTKHYEAILKEKKKAGNEFADYGEYGASTGIEFENDEKQQGRYDDWLKRLKKLAAQLKSEETVYFVIDAVDQMYQNESVKKLNFILNNAQIRYVLSTNYEYNIPRLNKGFHLVVEKIPSLNVQDAQDVIEGLLSASSRNVYRDIQSEILKKKFADNPLYISILIQRLNMMGFEELYSAWSEQDIIKHSMEVIRKMPDDTEAAAVYLLEEAVMRLDVSRQALRDIVNLIGVSRNGLRENDILAISKALGNQVRQLDISRLIHYLDSFFVTHKDGRIDFSHKVIRKGVRANADCDRYVKAIAARVKELGIKDEFWQSEGMYYARLTNDAKAAETVFRRAGKSADKAISESIKAEGLADGGEFYCSAMEQMEEIEDFFCSTWIYLFESRKEELELSEKVYRKFIEWIEKRYKTRINELSYILLRIGKAYANMVKILSEQGAKEEAFVYSKKALETKWELCTVSKHIRAQKELANEYGEFGKALLKIGKVEEANSYLEDAVRRSEELFRDNILQDDYDLDAVYILFECYANRGHGFVAQENMADAIVYYEKAINIAEKIEKKYPGINLRLLGIGASNMGYVLRKQGACERALVCYKRALEAAVKNKSIRPSLKMLQDVAAAYNDVAETLHELGRDEEAFSYYKNAIETEETLYHEDPDWERIRKLFVKCTELGDGYMQNGTAEQVHFFYEKALWAAEAVHKIDNTQWSLRELSVGYDNMGKVLYKMGQMNDALDYFYQNMEIVKEIYEENQSQQILRDLSISYNNIGHALLKQGEDVEAALYYQRALETKKKIYKAEPTSKSLWEVSISYENVASALDYRGATNESLEYIICATVTRIQYHLSKENYQTCQNYLERMPTLLKQYEDYKTDATTPKLRAMVMDAHGDYLCATSRADEAQVMYDSAYKLMKMVCAVSEDAECRELLEILEKKVDKH